METAKDAVGYCRVSTSEQTKGVSLAAQRSRIRAYAEAKDLNLLDVLSDEGVSGKTLERPGLREMIRRCEQGEVASVVVWKLDRLTRKTRHLLSLVDDLFLAREIELHSVSESLDTSTVMGRFVLTLFGGLAELERGQIAERTRAALAYKREQRQPTSHPPLGFCTAGRGMQMQPMPEELAIVHSILKAHRVGQSLAAIARRLNAEHVPTKRGRRWHASTVRKVVERSQWYAQFGACGSSCRL